MKWTIPLALIATASALRVESPTSLITCQPAAIQFVEGTAPYFIAVLPAAELSAVALLQFPETSTSPLTWNVNLPVGTNVTLRATDSTGANAYSSPVVVQEGATTSCVGTNPSASGSSGTSISASGSATASGSGTASASSAIASATPSGGAGVSAPFQGGLFVAGFFAAAVGLV